MQVLLFACRKCGGPVDPGVKAALLGTMPNIALDCACTSCGQRALYTAPNGRLPSS